MQPQLQVEQRGGCLQTLVVEAGSNSASGFPDYADRATIFHHSGDIGDIIYSVPVIKAMGGGVLYISQDHRSPMGPHTRADEKYVENLRGLLEEQDYILGVKHIPSQTREIQYDLNKFRQWWGKKWRSPEAWMPILELHLKAFDVQYDQSEPWLNVFAPVTIPGKPIVVNRTPRYHNERADMWGLIQKHHNQMVFIGTPQEYQDFCLFAIPARGIPYHPTATMLDVARVIAGCKVFVGGQSSPAAIAQGMGHRMLMEKVAGICRHAVVKTHNALYFDQNKMEIPPHWL